MSRLNATYRYARRNAARIAGALAVWRDATYYSIKHNVSRLFPSLNKNTKLPMVDKRTGRIVYERRNVTRLQYVHASYRLTMTPASA